MLHSVYQNPAFMPNPPMRIRRDLIHKFKDAYLKHRPASTDQPLPQTDSQWTNLALSLAHQFAAKDLFREIERVAKKDFKDNCERLAAHVCSKIEEAGGESWIAVVSWNGNVAQVAVQPKDAKPFEFQPNATQMEVFATT